MDKHPHIHFWKIALAGAVVIGGIGVVVAGGAGDLSEAAKAPLLALLGAAGYTVSLIPTGRSDALGRLIDYLANASVIAALVSSATNWLASTPDVPPWAQGVSLGLSVLILSSTAFMATQLLPDEAQPTDGEGIVEEDDGDSDGGDHDDTD